jgi:hypothetical protein
MKRFIINLAKLGFPILVLCKGFKFLTVSILVMPMNDFWTRPETSKKRSREAIERDERRYFNFLVKAGVLVKTKNGYEVKMEDEEKSGERTIINLVAGADYLLDMDVAVPVSKETEFSNLYGSKKWNAEEKGKSLIIYPPGMTAERAKEFCKKLPEYAQVIDVRVYSRDGQNLIISGPLKLSVEKEISLVDKLVKRTGERLSNIEERVKMVEKNSQCSV